MEGAEKTVRLCWRADVLSGGSDDHLSDIVVEIQASFILPDLIKVVNSLIMDDADHLTESRHTQTLREKPVAVREREKEYALSLLLKLPVGAIVHYIFAKGWFHKFVRISCAQLIVGRTIENTLGVVATHENAIGAKKLEAEDLTAKLRVQNKLCTQN